MQAAGIRLLDDPLERRSEAHEPTQPRSSRTTGSFRTNCSRHWPVTPAPASPTTKGAVRGAAGGLEVRDLGSVTLERAGAGGNRLLVLTQLYAAIPLAEGA